MSKIEKVQVVVGYSGTTSAGRTREKVRDCAFEAEKLGTHETVNDGADRGTTQELYRTPSGHLIVYVTRWSLWQGEATYYSLVEIEEKDLAADGEFSDLGHACGFQDVLTLAKGPAFSREHAIA